ncbi:MAG: glycosyltransferase family 4 protein [Alphaproteobacteria bacterium]|nr:glycosyltransferase family 4 protein [Alphaproteobacteria bacterium]
MDPIVAQTVSLQYLAKQATEFDVIHFHIDWMHLPLLACLRVPFLTTVHGRLDLPGLTALVHRFPDAPFVSISGNQRAPLPDANWIGTVYHGMPPGLLRPCFEPGSYIAFLGRLSPEKGAEAAIRIARQAGLPLRISAKVPRDGSRYFREKIEPELDSQIQFVGELRDPEKEEFLEGDGDAFSDRLAGAVRARDDRSDGLWDISHRVPSGSVLEVVEHNTSGFVVDSEAEAVAALSRIASLDRHQVRQAFERRFTTRQMTHQYLQTYDKLLRLPQAAQ